MGAYARSLYVTDPEGNQVERFATTRVLKHARPRMLALPAIFTSSKWIA